MPTWALPSSTLEVTSPVRWKRTVVAGRLGMTPVYLRGAVAADFEIAGVEEIQGGVV